MVAEFRFILFPDVIFAILFSQVEIHFSIFSALSSLSNTGVNLLPVLIFVLDERPGSEHFVRKCTEKTFSYKRVISL